MGCGRDKLRRSDPARARDRPARGARPPRRGRLRLARSPPGREAALPGRAARPPASARSFGSASTRLGDPGPRDSRSARPAGCGDRALSAPGGVPALARHRRCRPLSGPGARGGAPAPRRDGDAATAAGGSCTGGGEGATLAMARASRCRGLLRTRRARSQLRGGACRSTREHPTSSRRAQRGWLWSAPAPVPASAGVAREQLHAAIDAFERLGRSGGRTRRTGAHATGETARRRRRQHARRAHRAGAAYSAAAREGQTTREAAAPSSSARNGRVPPRPRLSKLGIHSAEELVAASSTAAGLTRRSRGSCREYDRLQRRAAHRTLMIGNEGDTWHQMGTARPDFEAGD